MHAPVCWFLSLALVVCASSAEVPRKLIRSLISYVCRGPGSGLNGDRRRQCRWHLLRLSRQDTPGSDRASRHGTTHAWFVATIGQQTEVDDRGKEKRAVPRETLAGAHADAGISIAQDGDFLLIDNGVYQFRVRNYQGDLARTTPLSDVPHWSGGMRVGDGPWDGRAWFEGDAPVTAVTTEIIEQGPVFIDLHITYHFAGEDGDSVPALPLELGKQTHTWEPNTPPREDIPARDNHYELKMRFVMGDPWIEVNERFHLPRSEAVGSFGVHQYWMQWGTPNEAPQLPWFINDEHFPVDTVTWVRWFLYDKFGGNTDQRYVAAEPRPDQKGRPFAQLRPRWNQGGGGAQDFCLTSGGAPAPSIGRTLDRTFGGDLRNLRKNAGKNEEAAAKWAQAEGLIATARNSDLAWEERFAALTQVGELLGKEVRQPAAKLL